MLTPQAADKRLARLRGFRNRPAPDLSLRFLGEQFKRDVQRPYQQLHAISDLWRQHIPAALLPHTRLDSLQRGTLRVTVDSSAHLYELDRLLRGGLHQRLIIEHKGPALRKIKLVVGQVESD